jgi:peptide/nickel transport system permease protein
MNVESLPAPRPVVIPGARAGAWTLRFFRQYPMAAVGGFLIVVVLGMATFGVWFAPFDRLEFHASERFISPSWPHVLGTDDRGRDELSRIAYASRVSLVIGVLSSAIAIAVGGLFGLVCGTLRGKVDFGVQRVVECFQAIPPLLLALAITTALKPSITTLSIALGTVYFPGATRVIRSSVLGQANMVYVDAARSVGASMPRIMFRHVLPNVGSILIVLFSATLAQAILVEAALSFLGVGVPPPEPSLGLMLFEAQRVAVRAPWLAIVPGIVITATVFGASLFGDSLRDSLDPRMRQR